MTTGRINQITTFAERPKTPATVKVYSKQQSFCWLLCKSLRPEGLSMIQAMFFTICVSWDTSFDRVIDTKCRRTSERRASLCRAKHAQTFTTENVCSLQFSFIAYCALEVHIQHFPQSKTPVRVFYQGKVLSAEEINPRLSGLNLGQERCLCSPMGLMAVCHALGKTSSLVRDPLPVSKPRTEVPAYSLLLGRLRLFERSRGLWLAPLVSTSLLVLKNLFSLSRLFFRFFTLPLLYIVSKCKTAESVILFFEHLATESMKN